MWGNIRRQRKSNQKQMNAREAEFQNVQNAGTLPSQQEVQEVQSRADQLAQGEQQRLNKNREGYKAEALKDVTTEVPGLDPKQRQAMQETAARQISGQVQNASRLMSSKMGSQGVRGGAANAMQSEIQGQGLQARNQFLSDLTREDVDAAMRNKAAYLTGVEGRTAQDILSKQQSLDYLTAEKQRRKSEAEARYYNKYFNRV